MKKLLALAMVICLALTFCACGTKGNETTTADNAYANVKIGMLTLHDDSSTYDKNFIDGMYRALDNLGMDKDQLVGELQN